MDLATNLPNFLDRHVDRNDSSDDESLESAAVPDERPVNNVEPRDDTATPSTALAASGHDKTSDDKISIAKFSCSDLL